MLEEYMKIFWVVVTQMSTLIIPVITIYIVVNITAGLLFQK